MKLLLPLALCATFISAHAQDALNMTPLGHLPYEQRISDVRGAVHNGREYALVGVYNGFSIVDVSDPTAPFEVFFEPGANSTWRDPFYNNGFAYCVNESSGGLLIVDMSPLPGPGPAPVVTALPVSSYTGSTYPWNTAHNISFDEQDRAYIYGSSYGEGGVIILDFSQSGTNPVELGVWDQYYVHDGFVRGDTLWAACVNDGFAAVVDISNPQSPLMLTNWATPSDFSHNIWPSDDNSTVFTTDEVSSGFVAAYDVTDLSNVVELDKVNHPLTTGVIPHNAHYFNGYVVTSHYRDGVTVHDASDPSNMILTGYYDSSPLSGEGFDGSWGAWPYLPSGILLNSDIEEGLFIVQPEYVRAARISGTVTNASTGVQLSAVNIEVIGTSVSESTGIEGTYASGLADGGTFDVTFVKGGFLPVTVSDVELVNDETTVLDVEMVPDVPITLQVTVTDASTGEGIEGATVTFLNSLFDIITETDVSGSLYDENFFEGTYAVSVGKWGYVTQCAEYTFDQSVNTVSIEMQPGYYDDFALDLGWEISGAATTGVWERGVPIATVFEGAEVNPGSHSGQGCGNFAFVTGNAGPPVQIDDVDDGATILTSPVMELLSAGQSTLNFEYWFYTGGGSSPSNDEMLVRVSNGTDLITLESLSPTESSWRSAAFNLGEHMVITDEMRVQFFIQDAEPGHLVEGGVDFFRIQEVNGVPESGNGFHFQVYPNPTSGGTFQVALDHEPTAAMLRIMDMSGRVVFGNLHMSSKVATVRAPLASGIYMVEVLSGTERMMRRLVISP